MKSVVLIGDSIRMGYEPFVRKQLEGFASVWGPRENGGTSENVLSHLDEWVLSRETDAVHVNCGLHDIKKEPGKATPAVPVESYAANVEEILRRMLDGTNARIVWATTTPVNEARHNKTKPFCRFEADVASYNTAATRAAERLGVRVNDLFGAVTEAGRDELLKDDGVHFTTAGCELLGAAVARALKKSLED